MPDTLLEYIFASAGLGALVGLIRQWSEQTSGKEKVDFGGVRTHTLWGILGCLGAAAGGHYSPLILPVIILALAAHLMLAQSRAGAVKSPGSTSFAGALMTLLIGALVAWGNTEEAVVVSALVMVILGLKQPIHDLTRSVTPADIRGTLQFVAITGVILPLVPNRDFGPFGAFNPYTTWLMVVLISGLGFIGYISMRLLGARAGLLITSLFGGLASSTASTLAFSKRSREEPELSADYAFAAITASAVMLPRTVVLIFVVSPELAWACVPSFALMAVPALLYPLWNKLGKKEHPTPVKSPSISNPLGLLTSIKFALLYAGIVFMVKAASSLNWEAGILPISFISGLTNMDAIALSMADSLKTESVPLHLATQAVIIGTVANSFLKAGLAAALGTRTLRNHVVTILLLTATLGIACAFLV